MSDKKTFVTLEEAQRCFECNHPGELKWNNAIAGGTLLSIRCMNAVCPAYETSWLVELDKDGKVQVNEKAYAIAHSTWLKAKIDPNFDAKVEQVQRAIDGQIQEETRTPGHGSTR